MTVTLSHVERDGRRASEISDLDERLPRWIVRVAQRLSPAVKTRLASALGAIEGEIPDRVSAA